MAEDIGEKIGLNRYNILENALSETNGVLSEEDAMDLLKSVSSDTRWSIIYNLITREVHVAMGMKYDQIHTFKQN